VFFSRLDAEKYNKSQSSGSSRKARATVVAASGFHRQSSWQINAVAAPLSKKVLSALIPARLHPTAPGI